MSWWRASLDILISWEYESARNDTWCCCVQHTNRAIWLPTPFIRLFWWGNSCYYATGYCGLENIRTKNLRVFSEEHVQRLQRHKTNEGDIIYPRRGDLAKCAYITDNETDWLCGTGCLKVTIDEARANSKYVYYHLQQPYSTSCIELATVGSTMPNLNTSILSR